MRKLTAALAVGSSLLLACPGEECPQGGTGTLTVEVSGLPGSTPARVVINDGDTERTASATTTFNDLPSGSYVVDGLPVAVPGGLVRTAYDSAGVTALCLADGQTTTIQMSYAEIPTSGKLWASNHNGPSLLGFAAAKLAATSTETADAKPGMAATRLQGVTFDARGNLWFAESGRVGRLPRNLAVDPDVVLPDVVIDSDLLDAAIPGARSLAFDAEGGLWVSLQAPDQVIRFAPDQLLLSGQPEPQIILDGIESPAGLAFSADGDLYVASNGGNELLRFDADQLTASGTPTPALNLSAQRAGGASGTLTGPQDLAFDSAGNLWVAYFASNVLARFTPGDLESAGRDLEPEVQEPAVQLKISVGALLTGIAFDEAGNLWLTYSSGKVARLPPSALTTSADVTPDVILTSGDLNSPFALAIYPAPAGSPLFHRLP